MVVQIIHKVLTNSGAEDLPALARTAKTCRKLRSFIFEVRETVLPSTGVDYVSRLSRLTGVFASESRQRALARHTPASVR
jgi:hypothetical protein